MWDLMPLAHERTDLKVHTVTSFCFQDQWHRAKENYQSRETDHLWNAFGVHPAEAGQIGLYKRMEDNLVYWLNQKQSVALGDVGLDYSSTEWDTQRVVLKRLCLIAARLNKPIIVYCKGGSGAYEDCLSILKSCLSRSHHIFFHHFEGDESVADRLTNMFPGLVFGIGPGIISRVDTVLDRVVRSMAATRILVENGSTYVEYGRKGSHPYQLINVATTVAELKGIPVTILMKLMADTFRRFFCLDV